MITKRNHFIRFFSLLFVSCTLFWACGSSEVKFKVKPDSSLRSNPYYPSFESGILILSIEGSEHKIALDNISETAYQGLPKSAKGSNVVASLESPFWKLKNNTISLADLSVVEIVPNGRLSMISGNVIDDNGNPIRDAFIQIGNDTILYTNHQGLFKVDLSYQLQKENQELSISKNGYAPQQVTCIPGNNLIVRLNRSAQRGGGSNTVIVREKEKSFGRYAAEKGVEAGTSAIIRRLP